MLKEKGRFAKDVGCSKTPVRMKRNQTSRYLKVWQRCNNPEDAR
jgi:hypothetical protein